MNERDIEQNLQALGEELEAMNIQDPVELLMIGGGFMLTQLRNRAITTDVDALVLHPDFTQRAIACLKRLYPLWRKTKDSLPPG